MDAELIAAATVFTDEVAQAVTIGECQHAIEKGLISKDDIVEIGAVITGRHTGRSSPEEITLFDGTGVGLQDLAVASAAVKLALSKGAAIEVDF
jgi:ornithine cyclodeaminase